MQQSLDLLRKQIENFATIPEDDWQLLLPQITERQLDKHDLFSREGKRSGEVGFITEGIFRQYYTRDGEEKTTWFFFEHDLICSYISCITGQPSLVTLQALAPATYLSFPYSFLEELYKKSMPWQTFGRRVAEYIATGLEERMVSLLTQKPEERYVALLNRNNKIITHIPQQYIANYLGITPVSMSRIRARFYKK